MTSKTLLLAAVLSLPFVASAQAPAASEAAAAAKLPTTAADHAAMAKEYEQKAAEWRKEAALHKQMAAEYRRSHPDTKSGTKNRWAEKMEKHCMAIVKDAEKLAADADWAAKYHQQRALELGAAR
ncbi:MAG: hypothetical protein QM704_12415 [Anaeromyxobacteraceae bacterium]